MLGAFRPSQPLSGGLLWKIPWRLSSNQKLRHRRRLRRVDNIVTVLDNALKRQNGTTSSALLQQQQQDQNQNTPNPTQQPPTKPLAERRHGKGPKQGEMVTEFTAEGIAVPSKQVTLAAQAAATGTVKAIERWKAEMPTEAEMVPKDKYTIFDRKEKKYRKGIHKLPKWTRMSQRVNPPGF